MLVSELQFSNAANPMLARLLGRVTLASEQPLNVLAPMLIRPAGSVRLDNE